MAADIKNKIKENKEIILGLMLVLGIFFLPPYQPWLSDNKANIEIIHKAQSFYGEIKIVDRQNKRYLLVDNITQSGINKKTGASTLPYVDNILLARFLTPKIDRALIIGLGAGTIPKELKKINAVVDIVEIDPKIEKIAVVYFDFKRERHDLYFTDGRCFINNTDNKYDLIVIDVSNGAQIPGHLLSLEALSQTRERLSDKGILVINTHGFLRSQLSQSLFATLQLVYPDILVLAGSQNAWTNIIFFANIKPEVDISQEIKKKCQTQECVDLYQSILTSELAEIGSHQNPKIITDDYNLINFWQIENDQFFRERIQKFFGKEIFII